MFCLSTSFKTFLGLENVIRYNCMYSISLSAWTSLQLFAHFISTCSLCSHNCLNSFKSLPKTPETSRIQISSEIRIRAYRTSLHTTICNGNLEYLARYMNSASGARRTLIVHISHEHVICTLILRVKGWANSRRMQIQLVFFLKKCKKHVSIN